MSIGMPRQRMRSISIMKGAPRACCGSLHPPVEVDHANFVVTVCFLMASQPRRGVLRLDRCSERVELRRVMNPDLKANFIAEL